MSFDGWACDQPQDPSPTKAKMENSTCMEGCAKVEIRLTEETAIFCAQEGRLPVICPAVEFSITDRDPDKAAPLQCREFRA